MMWGRQSWRRPPFQAASSQGIQIQGDGVAASCCAHLLQIPLQPVDRPRVPAILLGDQALALIRDIFDQPELLADSPRIQKRVVAWGPNSTPIAVEHSAILISEQSLLEALRPAATQTQQPDWTIHASRPLPAPSQDHSFGSRQASTVPITLKENSDPNTCWIESLDDGWLFLVPGWLLAVGAKPEALLTQSRLIAPQIETCGTQSGEFPAHARIASPLCGSSLQQPATLDPSATPNRAATVGSGYPPLPRNAGWLACGTAAMAFDPICGDGTAHAIREAILASAVIRAIAQGAPPAPLLAHYEARLTAGFRRHLAICRQFYATGGTGEMWKSELAAIERGIEWCDARLIAHGPFRYQLRGLELEAVC